MLQRPRDLKVSESRPKTYPGMLTVGRFVPRLPAVVTFYRFSRDRLVSRRKWAPGISGAIRSPRSFPRSRRRYSWLACVSRLLKFLQSLGLSALACLRHHSASSHRSIYNASLQFAFIIEFRVHNRDAVSKTSRAVEFALGAAS